MLHYNHNGRQERLPIFFFCAAVKVQLNSGGQYITRQKTSIEGEVEAAPIAGGGK